MSYRVIFLAWAINNKVQVKIEIGLTWIANQASICLKKKGAQSPCIIDLKKDVFRVIKSVGQRVPIIDFLWKQGSETTVQKSNLQEGLKIWQGTIKLNQPTLIINIAFHSANGLNISLNRKLT